ncbi:hypothetical protein [Geoalkalibacter subterraneus]|uniref:hypothetical protein n=1 Tax=Geoalkalibacter subterraneus TaxID=483547 RepID=UPI0011847E09|nr:hypothetical protein [Geoalkalibacter subterraneus]
MPFFSAIKELFSTRLLSAKFLEPPEKRAVKGEVAGLINKKNQHKSRMENIPCALNIVPAWGKNFSPGGISFIFSGFWQFV